MASLPTSPSADSRTRVSALREALATRVVVADGAMGTMLQAQEPTLDDFQQLEGCNEILNLTRPDIVRSVHEAYFGVGVDCVETNTFGANHAAMAEYDIAERVYELSEAGARIARETADEYTAGDGRPRWVLGSIGPGTKLPTLGHIPFLTIRDGFQANAEGLLAGGADALIVETTQDLLQTKASILGARRAMDNLGVDVPLVCSMAFETTGTMLLGSEIGAALTALEPLGIDMIGLNCSTGPAEMSEHLRYLARHSRIPLLCMPNAGLPILTKDGAHFPLGPEGLADAQENFVRDYGLSLIGGCCGTTPEHLRQVVDRVRGLAPGERDPRPEPGAASLY
ncbi:homocysteine S-methyltransferase family protein, partial [Streptomyces actinomycinicus]